MKIIELDIVDSTNNYAKSCIKNLDDRVIVHALRQTNGRGRLDRNWLDLGEGNLFFSIVLKPSETLKPVYSNLTQYACVCLCNIFERYDVNPMIKWPNDIMIDGERKISGILAETVFEHEKLNGIVLGIGVNLNATKESVMSVPDRVATGLNLETGNYVDPKEFLNAFLSEFFGNYDKFLSVGFSFIKEDYLKRNCFLNKDIRVQILNDIKSGYASKLNDCGELILQSDDKKELVLTIGDIL